MLRHLKRRFFQRRHRGKPVCSERKANAKAAIALLEKYQRLPSLHFSALVNFAQAVREQAEDDENLKKQSRDLLQQAVELLEGPRAITTGAESGRAQFFSQYTVAFDLLVDWCVRDGDHGRALKYAEASRNRTFLDQVRAAGINIGDSLRNGPDAHLLDEFKTAENEIRARLGPPMPHNWPQKRPVPCRKRNVRSTTAASTSCRTFLICCSCRKRNVPSMTAATVCGPRRRRFGTSAPCTTVCCQGPMLRPKSSTCATSLGAADLVLIYYVGSPAQPIFVLTDGDPPQCKPFPLKLDAKPLAGATLTQLVQNYLQVLRDPDDSGLGTRTIGPEPVKGSKEQGAMAAQSLTKVLLPSEIRGHLQRLQQLSQSQRTRV